MHLNGEGEEMSDKRIKLIPQDILDYRATTWYEYASTTINNKRLRLFFNSCGFYKVTYGEEILHEGTQLVHALAAWDSV